MAALRGVDVGGLSVQPCLMFAEAGLVEIPFDEVETKLRANAKLQVDHEAYLHADTNLPYGDVVKVMAAIKLAGADKMGLITDPLE